MNGSVVASRLESRSGERPLSYPLPYLRQYQAEAGRAVLASVLARRGLTLTLMMARQAGKNELSAQLELLLLLKYARQPLDAIKCAPSFQPQGRISLRRLWMRIVQTGLEPLAGREDGRAIRLGRARLVVLSAEPSSNVVGHTAGLLLEVDEAQDVDREKFDREFRPMAASTGATTVYYGTPWDDSTLLEQAVQTNLELERRDGVKRHFQADWMAVAECNSAYAGFVESERARLGESHPLFLTQYALKTVSGKGRLFNGTQRAQLQGTHSRQSRPLSGEVYVAGLDLGGQASDEETAGEMAQGHDATVLTIARLIAPGQGNVLQAPKLEIVEHLALRGTAHDRLLAKLVDLLGAVWKVRKLAVDATGLGETMARLLKRGLGGQIVQEMRFTAESKSRMGYGLLAAVNSGRLKMYVADGSPQWAEFWREVEMARLAYRPNRTMNFFVDPSQGHDDYLISMALLAEAGNGVQAAPRIAHGRQG